MSSNRQQASSTLFASLLSSAKPPKSRKAAEHLRSACDYLSEHRIEICVAEVAKLCQSTGPRAQSIHNNKGFLAYVNARKSEQNIVVRPPNSPTRFSTEDVQANAVIHALEAQVKREQNLKENLKRAIQNAGEFDIDAALRTGRLVRFGQDDITRDSELIELAQHVLNVDHLRRFGFVFAEDRVIAPNRNDRVFLEKRHVKKLQALLGYRQINES
jgi:hypothetical protein